MLRLRRSSGSDYSQAFRDFDELTLARWLAQTLGQLGGKAWRLSHPLVGAYRLAAQVAHENHIWLQRLVTTPAAYSTSPCCRAPMLPLLTRDVRDAGLVCQHCSETACALMDEIPVSVRSEIGEWAARYSAVHAVAHWDDSQRKASGDYDHAFETAAEEAERLLAEAGRVIAPKLLEFYPRANLSRPGRLPSRSGPRTSCLDHCVDLPGRAALPV